MLRAAGRRGQQDAPDTAEPQNPFPETPCPIRVRNSSCDLSEAPPASVSKHHLSRGTWVPTAPTGSSSVSQAVPATRGESEWETLPLCPGGPHTGPLGYQREHHRDESSRKDPGGFSTSMSPKTGTAIKADIRGRSRCKETVQAHELPAPWPGRWGVGGLRVLLLLCSPPRPWPCTFRKRQDGLAQDGDADTEGGTFPRHPR